MTGFEGRIDVANDTTTAVTTTSFMPEAGVVFSSDDGCKTAVEKILLLTLLELQVSIDRVKYLGRGLDSSYVCNRFETSALAHVLLTYQMK